MSTFHDGRSDASVDPGRLLDVEFAADFDSGEVGDYLVIDNRAAAAYDLLRSGEVVASLHYTLDAQKQEAVFVSCEIEETLVAARDCRELLRLATADVEKRGMTAAVTHPVALKVKELSA